MCSKEYELTISQHIDLETLSLNSLVLFKHHDGHGLDKGKGMVFVEWNFLPPLISSTFTNGRDQGTSLYVVNIVNPLNPDLMSAS